MSKYEKVWKLLDKYVFKTDPKLSTYTICTICDNLLLKASQGPCGCVYCLVCIETFLENNKKYCPGESSECNLTKIGMEDIIKTDNNANKRVSELKVNCPLGVCNFHTDLFSMCDHVLICEKERARNEELMKHMKETTQKYEELFLIVKTSKENVDKQINELRELMEEGIKKLKHDLIKHKEAESKRDKKIEQLEKRIEQLEERPNVDPVVIIPETNLAVQHSWDIDKFNRIRKNGVVVWSELFYSLNQEYLMRIWLHPNGCAMGTAPHMSIEFCICDDADNPLLKWPIKCEITIIMRNKLRSDIPIKTKSKNCLIEKSVFPQFSSEYFHFPFSDQDLQLLIQQKVISIECEATIKYTTININ